MNLLRACWLAIFIGCVFASAATDTSTTLRFRLTGDPATLDWNLAHSSLDNYFIMNLMEGLVELGSDLKPRPALAEKWEISEDGKTYRFFLKPNIKWSDGKPLHAQEFVDSWLRLLSPKTKSNYASFLFGIENAQRFHEGKLKDAAQVGIKALDANRLEVKLARPVPYFLHMPSFWVTFPIRLDLIKKHGSNWTKPKKLVTLGPYLLDAWEKGKALRLKKNPGYHAPLAAGTPDVTEIVFLRDDEKAREQFRKNETNIFLDATTEDLLNTKQAVRPATIKQYTYLSTYYLGFNLKHPMGKNPHLRKAFYAAIHRGQIPAVLQGGQIAATGWIPPGMLGHRSAPSFKESLFEARAALVKAGYPEGRGLGKVPVWIENFDGAKKLSAHLIQFFHDQIGVEIETSFGTTAEYQAAIRQGKVAVFVGHWGADFPDPANFFEVFVKGSGNNHTGWSNDKYDALVEKAGSIASEEERARLYQEAEAILTDQENVVLPLFYRKNSLLLGPAIESMEISPLNYLFLKTVAMKQSGEQPKGAHQ
ncbi:MAG: peptide ABC transporter substrate-binding protein [Bacteriovoracia bacterium]